MVGGSVDEGSSDYLQKELKACRIQLKQAERRAAAALESRDALSIKLEEAKDATAEVQRRLEVAVRFVLLKCLAAEKSTSFPLLYFHIH